jgi:hypothetical protein
MAAEDLLADATWQNISWRTGTKGKLKARFAAVRVRIADGPPQRIRDKGQQHLPGDEAWLIGEHRMSGEKKYYLANLPAKADLRTLAATIKARWICEQAHQQLKSRRPGAISTLLDAQLAFKEAQIPFDISSIGRSSAAWRAARATEAAVAPSLPITACAILCRLRVEPLVWPLRICGGLTCRLLH